MRGHVRKRGKGYSVVVELARDPLTNARRQRWHSGYRNKEDAEKALTKLLGQLDSGTYIARSKQTLDEYLVGDWLPAIKDTVAPRRSAATNATSSSTCCRVSVIVASLTSTPGR
jgi:hypothetical protein